MKPRDHLTPFHDINVNNPLRIREEIAARIERGEQIVDAAKKGEREITGSEQLEFDALMDEVGSHSKRTGLHGQLQLAELGAASQGGQACLGYAAFLGTTHI